MKVKVGIQSQILYSRAYEAIVSKASFLMLACFVKFPLYFIHCSLGIWKLISCGEGQVSGGKTKRECGGELERREDIRCVFGSDLLNVKFTNFYE